MFWRAEVASAWNPYVAEAVLEHLDDLDDVALAEQRLRDIQAGRSEPTPLQDVMKRYGMEG
jgi:RHH-type rel operon transcriptional repressor/antitoxin RelB